MDKITLEVNGQKFEGWKEAAITRSIKCFAGGFRLQITDNWAGTGSAFFIKAGDSCVLKVNDEKVLTGWIEEISNHFDGQSHSIEVSGRDKTGDLVDCSVIYSSHEILNSDLTQIATLLCAPFGIEVKVDADVGEKFSHFSIQPRETVFEALIRGARHRGCMFSTDGEGRLVIIALGTEHASTSLEEGVNLEEVTLSIDTKERFSEYHIKAQCQATDENYGEAASQIDGDATDPVIKRYRPLVIISEKQSTASEAKARVEWEAAYRAAESVKVTVRVTGFGQLGDSPIWKINQLVSIKYPSLSLDQEFLIGELEFRLSGSGGSETNLLLQRPDAFRPKPQVHKKGDPLVTYD